jgi:hypothetical protein
MTFKEARTLFSQKEKEEGWIKKVELFGGFLGAVAG